MLLNCFDGLYCMFFGVLVFCGIDFRYVDIVCVFLLVMYCRLLWIMFVIGLNIVFFCDMLVCSRLDSFCMC